MRDINLIIIHCTATAFRRAVTVEEVDGWHRDRGWKGIGYHYLIGLEGLRDKGRSVNEVGAHAKGFNANSIGVCLVGGLDPDGNHSKTSAWTPEDGYTDVYTTLQWRTFADTLQVLVEKFPDAEVIGHHDVNSSKSCPCFDVESWWRNGHPKLPSIHGYVTPDPPHSVPPLDGPVTLPEALTHFEERVVALEESVDRLQKALTESENRRLSVQSDLGERTKELESRARLGEERLVRLQDRVILAEQRLIGVLGGSSNPVEAEGSPGPSGPGTWTAR